MKTLRSCFCAAFAFTLVAHGMPSMAQELPTSTDLKAMYCLRVTNDGMKEISSVLDDGNTSFNEVKKDALLKGEEKRKRLVSYLFPRFPYLDMLALDIASKRADSDIKGSRERLDSCEAKKNGACADTRTVEQLKSCWAQCIEADEYVKRLQSCQDTSWLPF